MALLSRSTIDYVRTGWFNENEQVEMSEFARDGPGWVVGVVSLYLLIVLYAGPRFMQNREPCKLTTAIKAYNIINILGNVIVFAFGLSFTSFGLKSFMCDKGSNQRDRVGIYYGYFLLKVSVIDYNFV